MTLYTWSKTASNNATADVTINWTEGQAPSSVNDSARATMAAVAKFRDDNSGSITTSGTSTAYAASSNQVFDTLAHLDQQQITIVPHTTSGASPTLNVDGLGAKPIRNSTGVSVASGALVQGTPYRLTYYNTAGEFILEGGIAAIPGNFGIGGALSVTGAATLSSTLGLTGAATLSSTLSVSGKASFTSTDSMALANGTTAQRNGSPSQGDVRYNSTLACVEFWNGTAWIVVGKAPTVQSFTSGSGTYTPTAGVVRIRVRMCGGGGGGGARTTNNGSSGGATSFGSWTANSGAGGSAGGSLGGAGGSGGTDGVGTRLARLAGGAGQGGWGSTASGTNASGGNGGSNSFGGAGAGGSGSGAAGGNATSNSGGGGGGASSAGTGASSSGGGGGAGEYVEFWVSNPNASTYAIGGGGNGGAAGGAAGGNGATGVIVVEEFYS